MKYIVVELQTNADGTVGNLVYSFDTRDEAESKYHAILSAAAISTLPIHSAIMFTNNANLVKSEYYEHEVEINE